MTKAPDAKTRFSTELRSLLTIVMAAVLLSAKPGYADSHYADLVAEGRDALKGNEYDVAIARFTSAILLDPRKVEAWGERAEAYAVKGDRARAQADCAQGLNLAPNSSEAHRRCGFVSYHARNYQRAIADVNTALRLDHRNALAYADRGASYLS